MNLDEHVKTDGEKPCSSNFCFRQSITLVSARLAAPSQDMVPAENLHLISKLSCHFLLGAVLKILISAYNCNNFIIISWTVWVQLISRHRIDGSFRTRCHFIAYDLIYEL